MIIEAKGIRKDFIRKGSGTNVFTAVQETDLVLEAGVVTAIRGRSGSGKSTLLNMLAGILEPTAGEVIYAAADDRAGENLYAMGDEALSQFRNRQIGYIPQGTSAISSLTVEENILLPCRMRKAAGKEEEEKARAQALMEEMAIEHLAGEKPGKLSGGELRRMGNGDVAGGPSGR